MDKFAARHPLPSNMDAMTDPVRTIADRVRTRVLREGVDLAADGAVAARYANEEVRHYSERALGGAHAQLGDELGTARDVVAAITGYGPLQPYFDDPTVEEIWINAPTSVFVARDGVVRAHDGGALRSRGARARRADAAALGSSGRPLVALRRRVTCPTDPGFTSPSPM